MGAINEKTYPAIRTIALARGLLALPIPVASAERLQLHVDRAGRWVHEAVMSKHDDHCGAVESHPLEFDIVNYRWIDSVTKEPATREQMEAMQAKGKNAKIPKT